MNSIADEIDWAPYLLWNIIMPLTTERRHKLFAASSANIGGEFSSIIAAKDEDTGKPLMRSVVLGRPCDACLHGDAPHMCNHNDNMTAGWKDPRRSLRTAKVYKACGREGALMAELYSTIGIEQGAVFNRTLYEGMFVAKPNMPTVRADIVYIAVDPAGRGPCEFAITATCCAGDAYQVMLMSRENVFGLESRINSILLRTMTALRDHPRIGAYVPYVVAIEGVGVDAMYLASKFQQLARDLGLSMCVMREMKDSPEGPGWGVPKAKNQIVGLVGATTTILSQGLLCIPDDCASISSDAAVPQVSLSDQRNELLQQFMALKKNPDGTINGKAGGRNDDLIITLMMTIFWSQVFCQSDRNEYGEFKMSFFNLFEHWRCGTARAIAASSIAKAIRS